MAINLQGWIATAGLPTTAIGGPPKGWDYKDRTKVRDPKFPTYINCPHQSIWQVGGHEWYSANKHLDFRRQLLSVLRQWGKGEEELRAQFEKDAWEWSQEMISQGLSIYSVWV